MEIIAVKWNIVSEISKVLLNDVFAELDGGSGIKNIISYTDRLNIGGLQGWYKSVSYQQNLRQKVPTKKL